jgi:hypothetical protein
MKDKIQQVILDTNFLIYCVKQKIDYVEGISSLMSSGYELVVPNLVILELQELTRRLKKLSDRTAASLALQLLKHNKVREIQAIGENADDSIVRIQAGNIVATLDYNLKKKVEKSIVLNYRGKLSFG